MADRTRSNSKPKTRPFAKESDVLVVTGAAGFIGGRALYNCAADGYRKVVATDLRPPIFPLPPGVVFDSMDIGDAASVEAFLARHRPRAIMNIAAVFDLAADPTVLHRVNVQGPMSLLEIGEKHGLDHLVQTSSATVYGEGRLVPEEAPMAPRDAYATSKVAMEAQLGESKTSVKVTFLRPSAVYGPTLPTASEYGAVMAFMSHYLTARFFFGLSAYPRGGADVQASYVHVDDVVAAHLFVLERGLTGAFNISDRTPLSHRRLGQVVGTAGTLPRWPRVLAGVRVPLPERPLRAVLEAYRIVRPALARLGLDLRLDDGLLDYMFAGDQSFSVAKLMDHGFVHLHPDATQSIPPVVDEYASNNWKGVVGRPLSAELQRLWPKSIYQSIVQPGQLGASIGP